MQLNPLRLKLFAVLALCSLGFASAQTQPPVNYVRDFCVKTLPGKAAEFAAFNHDVTAKLMQARVDSGDATWGVVTRVVSPAGTSARCDYHIVYGYLGKLSEPPTTASTQAAIKRAGLNMTADELTTRRDSLSRLVSTTVTRGVDAVDMPNITKGAYVRINHYKIHPGKNAAWVDIERKVWKPLVVADNAAGHKSGWNASLVTMPSGTSVFSNATTVDIFPSWDAFMRGIPANALWPKVHTNLSMSQWNDQLASIVDRVLVEITTIVEMAPPKSASTGGGN